MPAAVETMFYYGETPWHGLGTHVDRIATSREAIKAAGLDWEVQLGNVSVQFGNRMQQVKGYSGVYRKTDGAFYGIVGNGYTPVQNKDAFKFFDKIVGEGQAVYHTAGSLFGGRRVWILAKLPYEIALAGEEIKEYIVLTTTHDGSGALEIWKTKVRVVCNNTLQMASADALTKFYARHTRRVGSMDQLEKAREVLGVMAQESVTWKAQAEYLTQTALPAPKQPLLLANAFGTTGAIKSRDVVDFDEISTRTKNEMDMVRTLVRNGRGQDNPKIQGTKWQWYNAVSEYVDHYKNSKDKSPDGRLNSLWFGTGALIKQRAWDYLVDEKN
jgi:phage/plasmid-like protein (TIGR03299 family)